MTAWYEGPLCGFDLETTGTDPEAARIVTACAAMDRPGEEPHVATWLADPGVPIPEEAAAVHGITAERARAEGQPAWEVTREVLVTLDGAFGGMPLIIYNAPYDLTVLDRSARRYNELYDSRGGWEPRRPVIDPLVLDKQLDRYRRGSRKLADTCKHYGITLENAHDATADTLAAIALARALAGAYPRIARMSLEELHEFQVKAKAEQAASFQEHLRRKGSTEVIDPSWPVIPWTEPEPAVTVATARQQIILAALDCLACDYTAEADPGTVTRADEELVLAARMLAGAAQAERADAAI